MITFLTILAIIWFIFMTVFGTIGFFIALRNGNKVNVKPWLWFMDMIVIAFLISRLIGAF